MSMVMVESAIRVRNSETCSIENITINTEIVTR